MDGVAEPTDDLSVEDDARSRQLPTSRDGTGGGLDPPRQSRFRPVSVHLGP